MVKTCKQAAVTFAMFVHLSTCHQLGNWWIIASFFFKFDVCSVLLKCVYTFHFQLQLGISAGYFTLKTMHISACSSVVNHWICFRIRNVLNTNCIKECNTIYAQERFSRSISFLDLIEQWRVNTQQLLHCVFCHFFSLHVCRECSSSSLLCSRYKPLFPKGWSRWSIKYNTCLPTGLQAVCGASLGLHMSS